MEKGKKMTARLDAHSHIVDEVVIVMLLVMSMAASGCGTATPSVPATGEYKTPTITNSGWLEIYFTDPTASTAKDFEGGPDEVLAAAIDKARLAVDMAAYSLNLWSIRDALIHAHQRGVNVRLVMESDNMDTQEVSQLQEAGIQIIGDQREGLMHNKFVVIDHSEVWTGSMNYTTSGAYNDNNDLVRIRSTQAAEDYTTEFNEMFVDNFFGPQVIANTPYPSVTIDGTQVEIYFSPDDGVAAKILSLIQNAKQSIYFMAYSFTSNDLGNAIQKRAAEGLSVAGVMDDGQVDNNSGTEYDPFMQAALDVRRDGNPGLMHHKVMIIDRSIVITGSYNFSESAETSNDENVVIIHSAEAAGRYFAQFQRVYDQAKP